ncbi:DEAD-domain-containing protein [Aureobasidium pullulans]|uniref:RNA helicase n=1 Tax=Aureobasidium pullulans TaxID=5580 RepID=A0A4S9AUV5_AURPU|nr:DEAD-domain-containing protein [Aureobasidium pullulans]
MANIPPLLRNFFAFITTLRVRVLLSLISTIMSDTPSKPLGDRLSFPDKNEKLDWAEESEEMDNQTQSAPAQPAQSAQPTEPSDQTDGASEFQMGSSLLEPEFDVNVKLNDLQQDPNNPLYSVKEFSDLNLPESLQKGISALSFTKPSKIQERALPLLLQNPPQNLIGQSQSGTGKTAAFVLNILSRLDLTLQQPQALVLAPSRELARQILGVVQVMGGFMEGLTTYQAVPDPSTRGQQVTGQVVVGTPGTVMDLARKKQLNTRGMKVLVLDEADNMLDQQGLGDQCKRVKGLLPKDVQTVLFSATFPEEVLGFADLFAPKANSITLERTNLTVKGIKQMYLDVSRDSDKYNALIKFYGLMTIASSIIFVRRRETADELSKRMESEGHHVVTLTGGLDGSERDSVIDRFREGKAKVLITTNVLARGIDVQTVTMVINYDIPDKPAPGRGYVPDAETFLHRVGRTGRFGKVGVALTLVHDKRSWEMFRSICQELSIDPTKLDTDDWDEVERVVKNIIKSGRNAKVGGTMFEG